MTRVKWTTDFFFINSGHHEIDQSSVVYGVSTADIITLLLDPYLVDDCADDLVLSPIHRKGAEKDVKTKT